MIVTTNDYKMVKKFTINQRLPFDGAALRFKNNVLSGTFDIMILKIDVADCLVFC